MVRISFIISWFFVCAFSVPAFGQESEWVYMEIRSMETDSVLHCGRVQDQDVHFIALATDAVLGNTAYVIISRPPNGKKNNATEPKVRPDYVMPSIKRI